MHETRFIGRGLELAKLLQIQKLKLAKLVVIRGRRRIGKSRLIDEFIKRKKAYHFIGLAPAKETLAQTQRDHFAFQLHTQTGLPQLKAEDWNQLFALLNERTAVGEVYIILDEITWMGSKDPDFLSKLHYAWETYFKKNPKLTLIICGSISAWIEKNILSSTGYFGRVSLEMNLEELPINDCNMLLQQIGFKGSSFEKLILLSILGGIPWYIEQVHSELSAVENIKRLCFIKDAILVKEFNYIFNDLFPEKRRTIQKAIVQSLVNGPLTHEQISKKVNYSRSGALTDYLEELISSGFVAQHFTWEIASQKEANKNSRYRIRDSYIKFYLKYIKPRLSKIDKDQFQNIDIAGLPGWDTVIGLQFENYIIGNYKLLYAALNINPGDILIDGPFSQNNTKKQQGCQIDYLIQTKYKTLYVCEIKFSRNRIGSNVITSIKEKINRLKLPRGFACIPVLIHASEVSQELIDSEYFGHIINGCEWLEKSLS